MTTRPTIEANHPPGTGFTLRLERPSGGVFVLGDPAAPTLDAFLPQGVAWLKKLGVEIAPGDVVLPE